MLQKCIFLRFAFLKLSNLEMSFSKARFLYLVERKKISNNPNGKSHKKNCSETRRKMVETGRFYIQLFMSIGTRENYSFLMHLHFHCCQILYLRVWVQLFYIVFFQHRNKTKATEITKHRREMSLLHTLQISHLTSLFFIVNDDFIMQSFLTQVLGFVNPVQTQMMKMTMSLNQKEVFPVFLMLL